MQHDVMKCQDLLAHLNDYVDGRVDPGLCEEFERHMAGCNPCQVVVDNIRCTITLFKDGRAVELPVPFAERLHNELRRRWIQRGGPAAGDCGAAPGAPPVEPSQEPS